MQERDLLGNADSSGSAKVVRYNGGMTNAPQAAPRWFHFRWTTTLLVVALMAMTLVAAREHYLKTRLMHAVGFQTRLTQEALQAALPATRKTP